MQPAGVVVDAALVMDCVTLAIAELGWLPRGAHAGQFIATARAAGLVPAACEPLTVESNTFGYGLTSGGTLHWYAGDVAAGEQDPVEVTLEFDCLDSNCSVRESRVVSLPRGWFCLGWVHLDDHGTQCFRSKAECERGREAIARETTPCSRDVGAAFCATREQEMVCFPSPWDCARESGGSIVDGTCRRVDR